MKQLIISSAMCIFVIAPLALFLFWRLFRGTIIFPLSIIVTIIALVAALTSQFTAIFGLIHMVWTGPFTILIGILGLSYYRKQVCTPIKILAKNLSSVANGDFNFEINKNLLRKNDEVGETARSLNTTIDILKNQVMEGLNLVIKEQKTGDVEARCNLSGLNGAYYEMLNGVNESLESITLPLVEAIGLMNEYAQGDFSKLMRILPGKQIILTEGLNNIRTNVLALITDSNMLATAAVEGNLSTRADVTKHQGDFRKIVEGVNNTLDAVIGPLGIAALYIERIAIGDMPNELTENYEGDFNTIKDNLNILIRSLNQIVEKAKLVAAGDLTVSLEKRSSNDELMEALNNLVKTNASTIDEFKLAIENIVQASQQLQAVSEQISQGSTEQAASTEEVTSSMEEMVSEYQPECRQCKAN